MGDVGVLQDKITDDCKKDVRKTKKLGDSNPSSMSKITTEATETCSQIDAADSRILQAQSIA